MQRPTKEQIRELPIYEGIEIGNIVVVTNQYQAVRILNKLKQHSCLGFDTESKPCFKKGQSNNGPHLIQLATESKAYLFPTQFHFNVCIVEEILTDPTIKKVGFGLNEDKKLLCQKYGIQLANSDELSSKVMKFAQLKDRVGARVAVAMLLKKRLAKSAQRSNWAKFPLDKHQIKYAANDAHAALILELEIERVKSLGGQL